jgi:hypothetical protein
MAKKARMNSGGNDGPDLGGKLDRVIHLLEDLFIFQAVSSKVSRDSVRAILGVHTTRISRVMKGVKQARKHGKEET